jgi:hypothetical protein
MPSTFGCARNSCLLGRTTSNIFRKREVMTGAMRLLSDDGMAELIILVTRSSSSASRVFMKTSKSTFQRSGPICYAKY